MVVLGLIAAAAAVEGISIALLVPLLGVLFEPAAVGSVWQRRLHDGFAAYGWHGAGAQLAVLLTLFVALVVLRAGVVFRRDLHVARLQIGFVEAQRRRVIHALAAASWERVMLLRHARVTLVLSGDIQRVGVAISNLLQASVALGIVVVQAVLALLLDARLAVLAVLLLGGGLAVLLPWLRKARALGGQLTLRHLLLMDTTAQFLGGLKLALSQALQGRFVAHFEQTLTELGDQQLEQLRQQSTTRQLLASLSAVVGVCAVWVGFAWLATPPPVLLAFLFVLGRLSAPLTQVQQSVQQLAQVLPAYEHVQTLVADLRDAAAAPVAQNTDMPTAMHASDAAATAWRAGAIVFDAVSYRHERAAQESGTAGVHALSLQLKPGEFLGIAGPSGAGKTTFADLLVGLYPPHSGQIRIGGVALTADTVQAWRQQLAYVAQDAFLFHESLRENLLWARPDADEASLWAALETVDIAARVRALPQGLDTQVGERGARLSGGERQRIALARALLRRPRLLVLDEATGAIDVAGERVLLQRLRAQADRPTIVMIAHRAESLEYCQRVLQFAGGRVLADTQQV